MTFIQVEDPYNVESPVPQCHGSPREVTPVISNRTSYVTSWDYDRELTLEVGESRPETVTLSPGIDQEDEASIISSPECPVKENLLTLRLLRHFKEGPGQWFAATASIKERDPLTDRCTGWTYSTQTRTFPTRCHYWPPQSRS